MGRQSHPPSPPPLPPCLLPGSSWTKRLITAYDYAAVQINIGNVHPEDLTYTGSYKTVALCGYIRDKVRAALVFAPPPLRLCPAPARVCAPPRAHALSAVHVLALELALEPSHAPALASASGQTRAPLQLAGLLTSSLPPPPLASLQGESDRALRELVAALDKE